MAYPDLTQPPSEPYPEALVVEGEWLGRPAVAVIGPGGDQVSVDTSDPGLTAILKTALDLPTWIDNGPVPIAAIPLNPRDPRHLLSYLDGLSGWTSLLIHPAEVEAEPSPVEPGTVP